MFFFFSSRRRHTRYWRDWSSDVCSSDLMPVSMALAGPVGEAVGIPLVFLVAGLTPPLFAVAAILIWRLPQDEIANPLDVAGRAEPGRAEPARAEPGRAEPGGAEPEPTG